MTDTNPLIGKTLLAVHLTRDREAIRFTLEDGEVIARCDADCCSYTWIEHVEMPTLPAKVRSVEDIEMPDGAASSFHPDTDEVEFYGLKIVTDKGDLLIDYRNDSNGYYGGSLSWPGEDHYGGVYGQNVADVSEWVPAEKPCVAPLPRGRAGD